MATNIFDDQLIKINANTKRSFRCGMIMVALVFAMLISTFLFNLNGLFYSTVIAILLLVSAFFHCLDLYML